MAFIETLLDKFTDADAFELLCCDVMLREGLGAPGAPTPRILPV